MTELRLTLYSEYFSGGGGGGKIFVDARICSCGNKFVVGSGLNHTPHACVEL